MSLSDAGADHAPPLRRRRGRVVRPARVGAVVALALLVAGGIVVGLALGEQRPPHAVLDVQWSASIFSPSGAGGRLRAELWTDPTLSSARLSVAGAQPIYYVRDAAGVWYGVGRPDTHTRWQRIRLRAGQEPSLLTEQGVRALFARLRARAGAQRVIPVNLRGRLAYAFPTTAVSWPFRYGGVTTVWLDGVAGLPLQYRYGVMSGKIRFTYLVVVDRIRTISSAALPTDYFTPPDRRPTPWEYVVQRVGAWLDEQFGRRG